MSKLRVVSIGECMIELSHSDDSHLDLAFAGDTLNTAVYLARTTRRDRIGVDYLTVIGDDPYSDAMLRMWQSEAIGTETVARVTGRHPGLYLVRNDPNGERRIFHYRSASAARLLFQEERTQALLADLPSYDCIYFSAITLSILSDEARKAFASALDKARQQGCRIAFDTNYRPSGWPDRETARATVAEFLQRADIVFPTDEDECALFGDADLNATAARYERKSGAEVIIKMGAKGCLHLRDGARIHIPVPEQITAVDTTAAGDAFNAGYLGVSLIGGSAREAAEAGHVLAAAVIRRRGAIIPREATPLLAS